jgi:hypothetical protein
MKAYIESDDENEDNLAIQIYVDKILIGSVELDSPIKWLYTVTNYDGDLVINNSLSMEPNKWDHITKEIIGDKGKHVWEI